ncbi:hypothetical protein [Lysobacter sp. H23M47]|uniref:hypothetical protein n=1 Tax=Lysobacter sp. H23M47 TaxID=2781024 RepID=UPI00187F3187|nr:hypothetical protein [Lysobacter sp. H23M47]QOW25415.1 hypothetical protein INQ43_05170 [Lysobacter sp. H23M47]
MSPQLLVIGILALAVLLGSARALRVRTRLPRESRPHPFRTTVLLLTQIASAGLLYFVLFPPPVPHEPGTLVVLTARADEVTAQRVVGDRTVALPEAGTSMPADAERFPDLASALRTHPATQRIRVLGAGLVARDRDAAPGLEIEFRAAPQPSGLVEIHSPQRVAAGRRFAVSGRAEAVTGGSVELRDPADRPLDRSELSDDGQFTLHASARSAGLTAYRVLVLNTEGDTIDEAPVPVDVAPPRDLKVLVLAGGPSPELKYLRRWALDAGAVLDTRISLGAGTQVGTAPGRFDAAALDQFDLLVLDDRSWGTLTRDQHEVLAAALDRGLGLLLRMAGPPGDADRQRLAELGFEVARTNPDPGVRLGGEWVVPGDAADALPSLTRVVRVTAADGIELLADGAGEPLGFWVAHGRGRVGVWPLVDSYRLVMAGRQDVHGEMWSSAFSTLARASVATTSPVTIEAAAPYQRSVICAIGEGTQVLSPAGDSVTLHIDPASGDADCAGFWANAPGWHELRDAEHTQLFLLPSAGQNPAMTANALRQATLMLAAGAGGSSVSTESSARHPSSRPGPRWPWFLAWLALAGACWWLERSRWLFRPANNSAETRARSDRPKR